MSKIAFAARSTTETLTREVVFVFSGFFSDDHIKLVFKDELIRVIKVTSITGLVKTR